MKELLRALLGDRDEPTVDIETRIDWEPPTAGAEGLGEAVEESAAQPASVRNGAQAIELHPEARTNFDTKAESLLSTLISIPAEPVPGTGPAEDSAAEQIVTRLPDHAIPSKTTVFRDGEGIIVARSFVHDGMITGVQGEGYRTLRKLAEGMQRTPTLRLIVGVDALERLIFDWVRARVSGLTDMPMSAVVLSQVAALLAEFEVVLPLFRVQLAEPIQIGRVALRTITSADFTRWESAAARATDGAEASAHHRAFFLQERKKMQGFAAATFVVHGEHEHVLEVTREEAEQAVSILRLFSPAMLSPWARSFCALWGRENIESTAYLLFEPTRSSVVIGSHADTKQDFVWRIDADRLHLIRKQALDVLLQALYEGTATAFRDEIRSALVLYSQSALRSASTEKLLAILIPLESFLLRNPSEPITESISVRFAFAIGETLEDRERIVEVARAAYAMRSAYVHHGRRITSLEELETLREFMQYAWSFFLGLGHQASRYRDRIEYLTALDRRKLA